MKKSVVHLGILSVDLHIPVSQSLKEKRRVVKSIKDRIRVRFNVSISEIGELDKWQTATLGICMIGNDKNHISGTFENILSLVEGVGKAVLLNSQIEFV